MKACAEGCGLEEAWAVGAGSAHGEYRHWVAEVEGHRYSFAEMEEVAFC